MKEYEGRLIRIERVPTETGAEYSKLHMDKGLRFNVFEEEPMKGVEVGQKLKIAYDDSGKFWKIKGIEIVGDAEAMGEESKNVELEASIVRKCKDAVEGIFGVKLIEHPEFLTTMNMMCIHKLKKQ